MTKNSEGFDPEAWAGAQLDIRCAVYWLGCERRVEPAAAGLTDQ